MDAAKPACKNLVLDAGPLLSLSPLRGLAERFLTVPQVLSELKDKNAREHFERLGLSAGVKIEVREPDAASVSQVVQVAKKTGDYSVLSHADICVLALTLALDNHEKEEATKAAAKVESRKERPDHTEPRQQSSPEVEANGSEGKELVAEGIPTADGLEAASGSYSWGDDLGEDGVAKPANGFSGNGQNGPDDSSPPALEESLDDEVEREALDVTVEPLEGQSSASQSDSRRQSNIASKTPQETPLFEDPSDEDDGEGDWITPANVGLYKSRVLDLLPSDGTSSDPFTPVSRKKGKGPGRQRRQGDAGDELKPREQILVGCMTADFAMQNVLLQMGLCLVGIEGKRIEKVKTWVLRCHACFKICKDSTKKFCPSCGNPTLLRTSVTAKTPTADESTPVLEVHLKKNFVYRTRGTIYSIPAPKPGSSKTGAGEGLILREDQTEYMRAQKREEVRREREEKKILQNALQAAKNGGSPGVAIGSWMDPDWIPEMMSIGTGGKGRRAPDSRVTIGADGMPVIGYGRKNPNEKRRKK